MVFIIKKTKSENDFINKRETTGSKRTSKIYLQNIKIKACRIKNYKIKNILPEKTPKTEPFHKTLNARGLH